MINLKDIYVNFHSTRKSIKIHIEDANPQYVFDFFLHGWNIDLEKELIDLYHPKKYLFEDNKKYEQLISSKINNPKDFAGPSQCLSIKKSIKF